MVATLDAGLDEVEPAHLAGEVGLGQPRVRRALEPAVVRPADDEAGGRRLVAEAEEGPVAVALVEGVLEEEVLVGGVVVRDADLVERRVREEVRPLEDARVRLAASLAEGVGVEIEVEELAPGGVVELLLAGEDVGREADAAGEAEAQLGLARELLVGVERDERGVPAAAGVEQRHAAVAVEPDVVGREHAAPDDVAVVGEVAAAGEEEEAVREDGPAEGALGVADVAEGEVRDAGAREEREGVAIVGGAGGVVAAEGGEAPLEVVRALARDDVDDAGEGLPVLRVERARDHLELLDGVVLDRDGEGAVVDVGDGEAVDPVADLAGAPAAEVPVDDARLQLDDLGEVLDGDGADLLARDVGRRGRDVALDEGARGLDDDLLPLDHLLAQRRVHGRGLVDPHADVLDAPGLEPDVGEHDGVGVGADADDGVAAVEVGGGALARPLDEDVDAGEALARGGVGDATGDLAGLGVGRPAEQHGEGERGGHPGGPAAQGRGGGRAGHVRTGFRARARSRG